MWINGIAGLARNASQTFQRNSWLQILVGALVFPNLFVAGYLGAFDSHLSVLADGTLAFLLQDASSHMAAAIILVSLGTMAVYWLLPVTERQFIQCRPYRRLRRSCLENATLWRVGAVTFLFFSSWFNLWIGAFLCIVCSLFLRFRLYSLERAIRRSACSSPESAAHPDSWLNLDALSTLSNARLQRVHEETLKARETNRASLREGRLIANKHLRSRARRAGIWPVTQMAMLAALVFLGGILHAHDVRDAPEFQFRGAPVSLISPSRSGVLIWDFDRNIIRNVPAGQMDFTSLSH